MGFHHFSQSKLTRMKIIIAFTLIVIAAFIVCNWAIYVTRGIREMDGIK